MEAGVEEVAPVDIAPLQGAGVHGGSVSTAEASRFASLITLRRDLRLRYDIIDPSGRPLRELGSDFHKAAFTGIAPLQGAGGSLALFSRAKALRYDIVVPLGRRPKRLSVSLRVWPQWTRRWLGLSPKIPGRRWIASAILPYV